MAMLHLFADRYRDLFLKKMFVAHVNHALRGEESDEDQRYVKQIAETLGVDCFSRRLESRTQESGSLEEWARTERYNYFLQLKKSLGIDYIATAHTADDQAETVLMRLFRGAGLRGLRGILPVREDGVIRPLLGVNRLQLLEWLEKRKIAYRVDSSNMDQTFKRNWVRLAVLPSIKNQEPEVVENLSFFAARMLDLGKFVDKEINKWLDSHVLKSSKGLLAIDKEGFKEGALATEAIVELYRQQGIPLIRGHIEDTVKAGLQTSEGGVKLLPGGWRLINKRDELLLEKNGLSGAVFFCTLDLIGETRCDAAGAKILISGFREPKGTIPRDNKTVWLDVKEEDLPLVFRTVEDKDQFWPLGGRGPLKTKQFLSKQGISRSRRDRTGVVVTARGEVVWVPGVRISHAFRVREGCRRVFIISYQPYN